MKKQMTKEQALFKLTAYCSMAEHCLAEVRKKLTTWEIPESDANEIVAFLLKEKYVDEARYARAFANDKMNFARWGRNKVAFSLRSKAIPADIISSTLDEVFGSEDYDDSINQVLAAKFRTLKYKNRYDAKTKLLRFGAGRGFEFQKMLPVVEKLVANVESDGSDDDF